MKTKVSENPRKFPDFKIENDKLWKHVKIKYPALATANDHWKEVVPKGRRKLVLRSPHDDPIAGHTGSKKTFERVALKYYWPKMRYYVAQYVKHCRTCQTTKPELKKCAGLMASRQSAKNPWETICVDLIGPLPRSSRGYCYILTIVDQLSKFPLLYPLRAATAKAISQIMEDNVFLVFGMPTTLICDNGVQFKSREFKQLCEKYGISISYTAFYHPQANPAERTNQVVKNMLRAYISDNHRLWDVQLAKVACAIRTSVHEVTKLTPYFINFGREMVTNGNCTREGGDIDWISRSKALEEVIKDVRERIKVASRTSKIRYDLRRRDVTYYPNDMVWRRNFVQSDAAKYFNAKLAPKYIGPYIVMKRVSPWTFELRNSEGKSQGVWHVKDLRPYTSTVPDD